MPTQRLASHILRTFEFAAALIAPTSGRPCIQPSLLEASRANLFACQAPGQEGPARSGVSRPTGPWATVASGLRVARAFSRTLNHHRQPVLDVHVGRL